MKPLRLVVLLALALTGCPATDTSIDDAWRAYEVFLRCLFAQQFQDTHAMVAGGGNSRSWETACEAEAKSPQFAFKSVSAKRLSQVLKDDQVEFTSDVKVEYSGNFGAGFFPPDRKYRHTVVMTRIDGVWRVGRLEFKAVK